MDRATPRHSVRPTSNDVARLAGVSQSTVSRAFTEGTNISDATRQVVLEAARQLDYFPNSIARSLITRQSDIIAIVLGDMRNPFYTRALDEFSERLQKLGKHVLVFRVARGSEVDDALRRVLQYQVDGIIVTAASVSMKMAAHCIDLGIPVVMFNRYVPGLRANTVCCDNIHGGRMAARALIAGGAQRFAVIYGDSETTTSIDRMKGFRQYLRERNIDPKSVRLACGNYTYEGGWQAAIDLLGPRDRPDAIFCLNDIMALGALDAARDQLGLRIPDDVAMIGFDDIPDTARATYDLTTVQQPLAQMIDESLELLMPARGSGALTQNTRLIEGVLVQRGSTRVPPVDAS